MSELTKEKAITIYDIHNEIRALNEKLEVILHILEVQQK